MRDANSLLTIEKILEEVSCIALQIQQCSDWKEIFQAAIGRARTNLQADRVLIFQNIWPQDTVVTLEAVGSEWTSIIAQLIDKPALQNTWVEHCNQDQVMTIADIHAGHLPAKQVDLLTQLQVQASLVVPIFNQKDLWGTLVVHQCDSPREWQQIEVQYVQQIALHFGLAIQQVDSQRSSQLFSKGHQSTVSLSHYERIVSATLDCVSLIDRNYIYRVVNQTYLNWNQKTYDEIVGHSVCDLLGQEFFETYSKPCLDRCLAGEPRQSFKTWQDYADGQRRFIRATYSPYRELDGSISGVVINVHDLTELKQAEDLLRLQSTALDACEDIIFITDQKGIIEWANPAFTELTGYSLEEAIGKNPRELLKSGQHSPSFYQALWNTILSGQTWRGEIINRRKDGSFYTESATITPVYDRQTHISHFIAIKQDITERKRLELFEQQRIEQERLLHQLSQHIHQSLDLNQILNTAVAEVRQFLRADRVIIYRLNLDQTGVVVAESVEPGHVTILGMEMSESDFVENQGHHFPNDSLHMVSDIYEVGFSTPHIEKLEWLQVKAKLIAPILHGSRTWGLIIAHRCSSPYQWQLFEGELLSQLATQMAIAIQQSELYQQIQTLNTELELQVQERTAQLQQVLDFEALLKRITDRVRDSLDESQILQTAVQELVAELNVECCDAALYDLEQRTATITYECIRSGVASAKGLVFSMDTSAGIHDQLLKGQHMQFCLGPLWLNSYRSSLDRRTAILSCPFQDEQGVIGDMWLFRPQHEYFTEPEVRLVEQVANQCAIALRQSRLYQAAQNQVQELERLNHLKDDFLSTVSHELRSPISNIKMATQMLEISLNNLDLLADESSPIHRYFSILQEEGLREINLINDLLDLARLDSGTEPLQLTEISLQAYIPHVAETFVERMQQQKQQFILQIPEDLPSLMTDLPYLERIITELLQNACKYTPTGETITLSAQTTPTGIEIRLKNSGVEISPIEHDRIFDKFYRIPNHDPWKHGGTGLGLALVKKLVEQLNGTIRVESRVGETEFIVNFQLIIDSRNNL